MAQQKLVGERLWKYDTTDKNPMTAWQTNKH